MRRVDREIKDERLIEAFIAKEQVIRIEGFDKKAIW